MMDGDTVFEPDTIRHLVQPFADPEVGAVVGQRQGRQPGARILGRWQHIEYVVGFNLERRLYDLAGCMPTVPGAVGAFRREALARRRRHQPGHPGRGHRPDHVGHAATAGTWSTRSARSPGPRRPRRCASSGASATAGATGRCRRCGSTAAGVPPAARPAASAARGLTYMFLFQVLLPLLAPVVDVFARLRARLQRRRARRRVWLAFCSRSMLMALYAFRLDGRGRGAVDRCRCSRWSTGS